MNERREWRIPLSRPDITEEDRNAVLEVLHGSTLSWGPQGEALEREFSERLRGRPTALVSSGTAGLYLALVALGVRGGEVITPSYGFIATCHAIRLAGAEPRFADIEPDTLNISPRTVEPLLSDRTSAILPVHLFGTPADVHALRELARARGVPLVEDAAEAVGSECQGEPAGTVGEAGVFAFYPNKQMTTGEGGLVVCRDPATRDLVVSLRNQGRSSRSFEFEHEGFNFRLTELQAALGRTQLARLEDFLAARERVAAEYRRLLQGVPGLSPLPPVREGDRRSWFVYPVFVERPEIRESLRSQLADEGIETGSYFPAIHRTKPYSSARFAPRPLPVTESAARRSFALPFHNRLERADQETVVSCLRAFLSTPAL